MAYPIVWQKLKDLAASVSGINESVSEVSESVSEVSESVSEVSESVSEVSESVSEVSAKVDGCLPLAGGTMSGAISASNPTGFDVGYSYSDRSGALIGLRSASNTSFPGYFEIFARNASDSSSLLGIPDGTLKWDGQHIVRSVNGVAANADGTCRPWPTTGGAYVDITGKTDSSFTAPATGLCFWLGAASGTGVYTIKCRGYSLFPDKSYQFFMFPVAKGDTVSWTNNGYGDQYFRIIPMSWR